MRREIPEGSPSPERRRSSSPSGRINDLTRFFAGQADKERGILPEQSISDAGIWQLREYGVEETQNEGKYSSALRKQELIPDTPAIDPHLIFSSAGTVMGDNIASTSNPKADVAVNSSDEEPLAKSAKLQRNDTAPSRRTDVLSSRKKGKGRVTTDKHQEPVEHTQKSDNPSSEDHVVTGDDLYLLADYVIDCKEDNTKFNSRDFLRSIDAPSTKTVALIADEDIQKCLDYANL
jgi:hypothetical protein